jgi:hypothetical protein
MPDEKLHRSFCFFNLSENYLLFVRNVLKETIKQGNTWTVLNDKKITEKIYYDKTKWSDFNIVIPVLFNFYHGLELLMKGLLSLIDNYELQNSHDIKKILKDLQSNIKNVEIINILNKYIDSNSMPKIFSECLKENNISINKFYIFLKYPTDKNISKMYNYFKLKYNEEEGLSLFKGIVDDIDFLMPKVVKIYREKESKS